MSSFSNNLVDRFLVEGRATSSLRVEQFLNRLAERDIPTETLLELLFAEITLRSDFGEEPVLAEYLQRYPQHGQRLRNLFELRQALSNGDAYKLSTTNPADLALVSQMETFRTSLRGERNEVADRSIPTGAAVEVAAGGFVSQVETVNPIGIADTPTLHEPSGTLPLDSGAASGARFPAIPGYVIEAELGRGGMGIVYRARQVGLNRAVALKMILSGIHAHSEELDRFRREAEAIARLQHPYIVQIYAIGEHDGLPYFALEYCQKGALDKRLQGTPMPPRQAAELVQKLAEAVQAAHDQGVIHRDLKPANILLGNDDRPKITDFGLAKQVDVQGSGQTASGAIIGTPSYMAPEQARGDVRHVGPAADVYALGAILYETLIGRPPFRAANPLDTIMQVLERDPVAPLTLNAALPADLNTICLKCLDKSPEQRYGTAGELAEELRRFLNGEPIAARPVSQTKRILRWCRRNPLTAGLSGSLAVTAILFMAVLIAGFFWIKSARDTAESHRIKAETAEKVALASAAQAQEGERAQQKLLLVEQQARKLEIGLREQANRELAEARRQRERAHFYLESFLNLKRFGRDLASVPLRNDFEIKVAALLQAKGAVATPVGKRTIAQKNNDESQRPNSYSMKVDSDRDCYMTVLYVFPEESGRACLQVFPNHIEQDNNVKKGVPRTILNDVKLALIPTDQIEGPAFLYVIATDRPWDLMPDSTSGQFQSFSSGQFDLLSKRIKELVESQTQINRSAQGLKVKTMAIAEEILLFSIRPGNTKPSRYH